EENGGGKVLLLERGVFAGVHAAMMVHPAPVDAALAPFLALEEFRVRYTGKAAHASAFPELGINAADALTVAQTAIGLLRQHLKSTHRVHGICTHGGDAPNIVPAHIDALYTIRARTFDEPGDLRGKGRRCFEAGALATGAGLAIEPSHPPYAEVHHDAAIAACYRRNAEALGRSFVEVGPEAKRGAGSTDMGNISRALPAIHPVIGIGSPPAGTQSTRDAAALSPPPRRP